MTAAMRKERPAKSTIRARWLQIIKEYEKHWSSDEVLYTTLCGAEALDIRMMVADGLIKATEVGGIADSDKGKVVAVEAGLDALLQLRQSIPGLRVIDQRIDYIVGGASDPNKFPEKKKRDAARARVINLDFNGPLKLDHDAQNGFKHPDLETVRKLAALHGKPEVRAPWCLLLTFQSEITWSVSTQQEVFRYLSANASEHHGFGRQLKAFYGDELFDLITGDQSFDISTHTRQSQQLLLSAFVAKRVALLASTSGWKVTTRANWRYGGEDLTAPMCTWIFDFSWDPRGDSNSHAVYQDSLSDVLSATAVVNSGGTVISDAFA
ncbi:hypothetical protein BKA04_001966 [Cryobacterium mesophilum]|uniref:hypothetical protein n=1 Tax=Terrimesophilobacter mesophilus TaxID=433647 RepID=UPI0011B00DFD|nr:hypothetical protein [Terrimesophilobacter mesophilus]MBB5633743.1 hypothetical protein [Terrimesophilobacter mesophilus]